MNVRRTLEELKAYPGMVRWYNPRQLSETGMRDVITRIFGQFADQRILQATIDGFSQQVMEDVVAKRHDYSKEPDLKKAPAVWIDYTADLGDGFDSTFAIASLIAADKLNVPGAGELPGGKFLLLGGDQVYPFPTRANYQNKFAKPYALALPGAPGTPARRHMFALPGNHDWYDGLNAFDNMFCKARYASSGAVVEENRIEGWLCPQHRSYWSIRLPHNWWIWGADIQVSHYLDAGQILYFKEVAREMAKLTTDVPKVVLCISEPSWMKERRNDDQGEDNLDTIINIALDNNARIAAVLTGDYHHYNRYISNDLGLNFITAGGGGAYFSPTHPLKQELKLRFNTPDGPQTYDLKLRCKAPAEPSGPAQEACWPARGTSRMLSFKTLLFPFRNYGFSAALGFIYWLLAWPFSVTDVAFKDGQKRTVNQWIFDELPASVGRAVEHGAEAVAGAARTPDGMSVKLSLSELPQLTIMAGVSNPALGLAALALIGLLMFYADAPGLLQKFLMGLLHGISHLATAVVMYIGLSMLTHTTLGLIQRVIAAFNLDAFLGLWATYGALVLAPPFMILIGGIAAGLVWGLYLMISCLFNRHCDQAFSSLRLPIYRHFLRLKIEPHKLTIFPIGLRSVPSRWRWKSAEADADNVINGPLFVPQKPFAPELIDGPIEIPVDSLRGREAPARPAAIPEVTAASAPRAPAIGLVRRRAG